MGEEAASFNTEREAIEALLSLIKRGIFPGKGAERDRVVRGVEALLSGNDV